MSATDEELRARVAGWTVSTEFIKVVDRLGDQRALRWMTEDGGWGELSFGELADKVARAAGGLRSLGVGPGDRVVIMMRNIPEFHWVDLAAVFLGATPISI